MNFWRIRRTANTNWTSFLLLGWDEDENQPRICFTQQQQQQSLSSQNECLFQKYTKLCIHIWFYYICIWDIHKILAFSHFLLCVLRLQTHTHTRNELWNFVNRRKIGGRINLLEYINTNNKMYFMCTCKPAASECFIYPNAENTFQKKTSGKSFP